ncbi:hypothetical protein O6H91_15G006200 [Diphasiastrum complanatum]|nr:hypothetical protein O6H91_15G006200 [Diphasiastrum complanatum]KAJ7528510.1 hypothetical protein O6H91_15G006200 [Diphasiastrum complanatum]KAJ7528512.1 hypothetical protein O6H91_15G006200 [Diphasiastrum complanatum]
MKQSENSRNESEKLADFDNSDSNKQLENLAVAFSKRCKEVLSTSDGNTPGFDIEAYADIRSITEELSKQNHDLSDTEADLCLEVDVPVEKLEITSQELIVIVGHGSRLQTNGVHTSHSLTFPEQIQDLQIKDKPEKLTNYRELCQHQVHSSQIECIIAQPTQGVSSVVKVQPDTLERSADESLEFLKSKGESVNPGYNRTDQTQNASTKNSNCKGGPPDSAEVKLLPETTEYSTKRHSSPLPQQRPLLDLNVKEKDFPTASIQQPFTDAQQCQLRTQILVYGSLIEGTLPGEALMGVAFADISNETRIESWDSYIRRSKRIWEKIWQTAGQKSQRKVSSSGALPHARISNRPSTLVSTGPNKSSTPFKSPKTTTPIFPSSEAIVFDAPISEAKTDKASNPKLQTSKGLHPTHITSSVTPVELRQKSYASSCSPSSWGVPSRTSPVAKRLQGARSHLDHWQMRYRNSPYTQQGSFQATASCPPWFSPYSSGHSVPPLCARVMPPASEAIHAKKAIPTSLSGSSGCHYLPVLPTLPILHPYSSKVVATSGTNAAGGGARTLGTDKAGVRKCTRAESQWKRRKAPRFVEGTKAYIVPPALAPSINPSIMPNLSGHSFWADQRSTSNCAAPSTAFGAPDTDKFPVNYQGGSEDRCTYISRENLPPMTNVAADSDSLYVDSQSVSKEKLMQRPFLRDNISPLEQAKLNAHKAASAAAMALEHSQSICDQLRHSNDGTVSQIASSTAAVAAAASVAKAAAAAAKLAYEAAIQAKSMVNETMDEKPAGTIVETGSGSRIRSSIQDSESMWVVDEMGKDLSKQCQVSSSCKSVITLAKASVRKQIESAAAATRRAQNLDALVQAAELAVGAALQAGAVVAMGEPAPLTPKTLREVGFGALWKIGPKASQKKSTGKVVSSPRKTNLKIRRDSMHYSKVKKTGKLHTRGGSKARQNQETKPPSKENQMCQKQLPKEQKGSDGRGSRKLQSPKKVKEVLSSRIAQPPPLSDGTTGGVPPLPGKMQVELNWETDEILEGSVVEVVPDEEGLQGVWFSAKVLSTNGNQALVVYDELLADDGNGQLQEWVPLQASDHREQGPPRVRLAHPMIKDEASRKRRRSAMGNQMWRVGDHVDAWMRDGWWEGIVTSMSSEDENKVIVFFPGDGDIQVIKSWNLRPSLVWKNGRWIVYSELSLQANVQEQHPPSTGPSTDIAQHNKSILSIIHQERESLPEFGVASHAEDSSIGISLMTTKKAITPSLSPLGKKKQNLEVVTAAADTYKSLKRKKSTATFEINKVDAREKFAAACLKNNGGRSEDGGHSSSSEVSSEKPAYVIQKATRTPLSLPLYPNSWTESEIAPQNIEKRSENQFAKKREEASCDTEMTLSASYLSGNISSPHFSSQKRPTPEVRKRKYQKQYPKTIIGMKIDGKQPFAKVSSTKIDKRKTRRSLMQDLLLYTDKQVQLNTISAQNQQNRCLEALEVCRKSGRISHSTH